MLKFDLVLKLTFEKMVDPNETIHTYFHSKIFTISTIRQIPGRILEAFKGISRQVEDYLERGSGWVIQSIDSFDVHISKYQPF